VDVVEHPPGEMMHAKYQALIPLVLFPLFINSP
jgi:hypothetical protein